MIREPVSTSSDLTSAISTACDAILRINKNAQDTSIANRSSRSQAPTLNEACQATERVWSTIISSLQAERHNSCVKIEHAPLATPMSSIVRFFLGQLHQHCLDEAERRHRESPNTSPSEILHARGGSRNAPVEIGLFQYNSNVIKTFLIYIMSTAIKLHAGHQEIFDAITSAFLQHLGESMGLYLFGTSDNGCTTEYAIHVPGVSKALRISGSHAKSAAQIEAPYLVEILRTFVQTIVPERLGSTSSKLFRNLQKTLLQGVFGSEDHQTPFPTYSAQLVEESTVIIPGFDSTHDEDDEDWFLAQVWELLGWDILIG
jgi:hypothetical protein